MVCTVVWAGVVCSRMIFHLVLSPEGPETLSLADVDRSIKVVVGDPRPAEM